MRRSLERLVRTRANSRCEYCQMPQDYDFTAFEIDHVIAISHAGRTRVDNLARACFLDNNRKGPNLSGIDPVSGKIVTLFNPRRQKWARHFRWDGPVLLGRTQIGRATIAVMEINLPARVQLREVLMAAGLFPPF